MPKTTILSPHPYGNEKLSPIATLLIIIGFSMIAWGLILLAVFG